MSEQDDNDNNNVTPITKNRKPAKLRKNDFYRVFTSLLLRERLLSIWKPFPYEFKTIRDSKGDIDLCMIDSQDVVSYVSRQAIVGALFKYLSSDCPHIGETLYKTGDINEVINRFIGQCEPLDMSQIKPVRQLSEPGLTYRRLPFDFVFGQMNDLYDDMTLQVTNHTAFFAWIGSLFFQESDRQQYLWLYSDGRTGKGSLARLLQRTFGPSFTSEQPPAPEDRFWTSGLLGKRLVVFPDCNHYSFTTTGLFKSLTGGDRVRIERKGCQPFDADLNAKYMFLSNERPNISSQAADMRRMIFCEMGPIRCDYGPNYEEILWRDAAGFFGRCVEDYLKQCQNHGTIPVDHTINQQLAALGESDYQVVFDKYFVADSRKNIQLKHKFFVKPEKMRAIMASEKSDRGFSRGFKKWVERVYGVKYMQVRLDEESTREYRWVGLREKSVIEQNLDVIP